MLWKETDHTAPAEALGPYQITTTALEAIKHTGAIALAEPIRAQLPELLPIEAQAAQRLDLPVEPTEVPAQQGLQAEPIEVVRLPDHRAVPIEVPAIPAAPVAA
jgi:hypothetical protein